MATPKSQGSQKGEQNLITGIASLKDTTLHNESRREALLQNKNSDGLHPQRLVMEASGDPGVRNGNPRLQHLLPWATSTLLVLLEGAFTSRTARWQWRDWLRRAAAQPSILQLQVTKTQGWQ